MYERSQCDRRGKDVWTDCMDFKKVWPVREEDFTRDGSLGIPNEGVENVHNPIYLVTLDRVGKINVTVVKWGGTEKKKKIKDKVIVNPRNIHEELINNLYTLIWK